MRDFFQMAVETERYGQNVFLGNLLREGKRCGLFVSPLENAGDVLGTVTTALFTKWENSLQTAARNCARRTPWH